MGLVDDRWAAAAAYERFMGRWSRRAADAFVDWLRIPPGAHWLEVGSGTGSLTAALCARAAPATVVACEPAAALLAYARTRAEAACAAFVAAGVGELPRRAGGYDCSTSLFALNFFPDTGAALDELRAATRPGGCVSACVWDYSEGMQFLRYFWDAAAALDPGARALDEGVRFPLCRPAALMHAFRARGLEEVRCETLEVPTVFADFDDYWQPLLGGTGPAPAYVASLGDSGRRGLGERLRQALPRRADGSIPLVARAWAVRGEVPGSDAGAPTR